MDQKHATVKTFKHQRNSLFLNNTEYIYHREEWSQYNFSVIITHANVTTLNLHEVGSFNV